MIDQSRQAGWAAACRYSQIADDTYDSWVAADAPPLDSDTQALRLELANAASRHTVTLAVADAGSDEALSATLASLAGQAIRNFDTLVVCQPAREAAVARILATLTPGLPNAWTIAAVDILPSFELEQLALERATGRYFGVVFAGDRLAPMAVAAMQSALVRWPDAVLVYSDEDWIDEHDRRLKPRFKSAWDPEAQLGFDLLGSLCLIERTHALEAGGFRAVRCLAAHYDLHCRVALPLPSNQIRHVPAVLYHRRVPPLVSAQEMQTAIAAYSEAARQVAADAGAAQSGGPVDIAPSPVAPFVNHVRRPVPTPAPKISVLVPTRDRAVLLRNCLRGLLEKTDYPDFEVIVLDNDSVEPATMALFSELKGDPRVRVLRAPGAFNFSGINNLGVRATTGEVLLFLNNDIEVLHGSWMREMVGEVMRPDIGCVGAKLLYSDGTIQHAGVLLQAGPLAMHVCRTDDAMAAGTDGRLAGTHGYLAVTGACLAVRRSVFDAVGGFDADHLPVAYNDIDLCLKVSDAGYRNICTPFASLLHLESASRGLDDSQEKQARARSETNHMRLKWGDRFDQDPFHNPNLHLEWSAGERLASNARQPWLLAR
ncbi:glycosyltransferase family 2 protein [Variovorax sp. 770b2]|uniref:glycosyltransferase family 2 protein n=1 Tax=Variovorax sp. 770b2 TaxID=1566271 RepID=UPI0008EF4AE5|nr:glycosyltransferase family 2 protein [Variovorax sp. 770b2]SFQ25749.1 Glycosyltransferase, GT2 family [Variovorax sp. 770b2]